MKSMKTVFIVSIILGLIALTACSSAGALSETITGGGSSDSFAVETEQSAPAGAPGIPGATGNYGSPALPAPTPAPAQPSAPMAPRPGMQPAPEEPSFQQGFGEMEEDGSFGDDEGTGAGVLDSNSSNDLQADLVVQQRIIVRTVDMSLVVDGISEAVDQIADMAERAGGWVVSSDRSSRHRGFVSIRVPAAQLDDSIQNLRDLSVEVESESTNSQDVTDEYVDLTARLVNLQATEGALLRLLDQADNVEDALNVQRELSRVQEDVERIQGRIKFLEETAAFSLINVRLSLSPVDMPVDAGLDQTYSVGQVARFRATFEPPEGIEDFFFTWDFGDGTPEISSTRTAPSSEEGKRITTTVTHQFFDDRDSPYIVEIEMTGTGDAGVTEGMDTIIATVTRIPTIEVFGGNNVSVEAGEEVSFEGSFTRPQGLTELTYEWDFGDNSPLLTGSLEEGVTRVPATHTYSDHRPFPYEVTLTIKAQSEAGEAEASNSLSAHVSEQTGFVVAGWSAGETGKTAVRTLSVVAQIVSTILIWLAIFSPVWIVIGIVVFVINKNFKGRNTSAEQASNNQPEQAAGV